jgi:hypothetical protein
MTVRHLVSTAQHGTAQHSKNHHDTHYRTQGTVQLWHNWTVAAHSSSVFESRRLVLRLYTYTEYVSGVLGFPGACKARHHTKVGSGAV